MKPDKYTQYLLDFTEAIFHVARTPHKVVPKTTKISKPLPPPPLPPHRQVQKLPPPPELAPTPIIPKRMPPPKAVPQKSVMAPIQPMVQTKPVAPPPLQRSAMDQLKDVSQQEEQPEKPKEVFKPITYPIISKDNKVLAKAEITKEDDKKIYKLSEPQINPNILSFIKEKLAKKIKKNKAILKNDKLITKTIKKAAKQNKVPYSDDLKLAVMYYLKRDFIGMDKLDALLKDRHIQKITCEGLNKPIKVTYDNEELKTNIVFTDHEKLNRLVKMIAHRSGKKLSKESPLLESTLDNLKIHATLGTEKEKGKFSLEPTVSDRKSVV